MPQTEIRIKGRTPKTCDLIRCTYPQRNNVVMKALAMRHFYENPDCNFVQVWEHGGWFLGFRRDGSIWATANDQAQLDGRGGATDGFSGIEVEYPDLFSLDIQIYDAAGEFAGRVMKMGGGAECITEPGVVKLTEAVVIDYQEREHRIRFDPADGKWKIVA